MLPEERAQLEAVRVSKRLSMWVFAALAVAAFVAAAVVGGLVGKLLLYAGAISAAWLLITFVTHDRSRRMVSGRVAVLRVVTSGKKLRVGAGDDVHQRQGVTFVPGDRVTVEVTRTKERDGKYGSVWRLSGPSDTRGFELSFYPPPAMIVRVVEMLEAAGATPDVLDTGSKVPSAGPARADATVATVGGTRKPLISSRVGRRVMGAAYYDYVGGLLAIAVSVVFAGPFGVGETLAGGVLLQVWLGVVVFIMGVRALWTAAKHVGLVGYAYVKSEGVTVRVGSLTEVLRGRGLVAESGDTVQLRVERIAVKSLPSRVVWRLEGPAGRTGFRVDLAPDRADVERAVRELGHFGVLVSVEQFPEPKRP